MFPYFDIPPLPLGPVSIQPFGTLVVIGILVAGRLMTRRSAAVGLNADMAAELIYWLLVPGFAGAVLAKTLYDTDFVAILLAGPAHWLDLYQGIASFGGILGGAAGGLWFAQRHKLSRPEAFRYLDAAAWAFPAGLFFGRLGCYVVHDHPGVVSASWLAVKYPGGARFDLGLLEALFLIPTTAALWWYGSKPRTPGRLSGWFLIVYGVFRAALDRLHEDPPEYLGFTVDQILAGAAVLVGVWFLLASRADRTSIAVERDPARKHSALFR